MCTNCWYSLYNQSWNRNYFQPVTVHVFINTYWGYFKKPEASTPVSAHFSLVPEYCKVHCVMRYIWEEWALKHTWTAFKHVQVVCTYSAMKVIHRSAELFGHNWASCIYTICTPTACHCCTQPFWVHTFFTLVVHCMWAAYTWYILILPHLHNYITVMFTLIIKSDGYM